MGAIVLTSTLLLLSAKLISASSPCYDHQKDTYATKFKPAGCDSECIVTPFFSPDHSVDAYVQTINDAQSSIDLLEPGERESMHERLLADRCLQPRM